MYRFKYARKLKRNPVVASSRKSVIKKGAGKSKAKVGSALDRMVRLAAAEERIAKAKASAATAKTPAKAKAILARAKAAEKLRKKLAGEFKKAGQRTVSPTTAAKWKKSKAGRKAKAKPAAARKTNKKVVAKRVSKVSAKTSALSRERKSAIRSKLWKEAGRVESVYRQLCKAHGL